MTHIIPYFVMLAAMLGTVANSFRKRWCFWIWSCTNAFWCMYNALHQDYAQMILYAFHFAMAMVGLWKWKTQERDMPNTLHHETKETSQTTEEVLLDLCEQASSYQTTALLAAVDALGKQSIRHPVRHTKGEGILCPSCLCYLNKKITNGATPPYCQECGQALDWTDISFDDDPFEGTQTPYEDEVRKLRMLQNSQAEKKG